MELTVSQIARFVDGTLEGDGSAIVYGVAKIEDARDGEIAFISNPKYAKFIESTQASAVIVGHDFPATEKTIIRTANPYVAFLRVLRYFHPRKEMLDEGIHPSAVIHPSVFVGEGTRIGAGVVIGKNSVIAKDCQIFPNVVIGEDVQVGDKTLIYANVTLREQVHIGRNVIIHSGTVIGSDGFGFAREGEIYHKIPQVGIVIVEDDVEIGANCTIDRATLGQTIIRKGVKLDNLIQVAHNVEIGENTVIAAQSGIAGSTKLGKNVVIGGQVGIVGHIEIADQVTIAAQSGVTKPLPSKIVVFGYPARPIMQAKREEAALRKLPQLLKRISELEAKITRLENA
ncbi:MAG: UDP-3-O-(3-hydroxymyristoyl)glucosamine N-acyltransferase [Calditrichaeota bacterium]|nr:UDP-3-O-(3-hydroxymyristoyl)glucosamine N-acyltransferase [Calditrichota bacterium]